MSAYPIPINIESPGANLEAYVRAVNAISLLSVEEERALAERLHGQEEAEAMQRVAQAVKALLSSRLETATLAAALAEGDLGQTLAQLIAGIQAQLRALDSVRLTSSQARAAFVVLDEILQIQRVLNAGSNPNPQLLLESLVSKVQRVLGDGGLGDNIDSMQKGARS